MEENQKQTDYSKEVLYRITIQRLSYKKQKALHTAGHFMVNPEGSTILSFILFIIWLLPGLFQAGAIGKNGVAVKINISLCNIASRFGVFRLLPDVIVSRSLLCKCPTKTT
jgi:hypothetical protein